MTRGLPKVGVAMFVAGAATPTRGAATGVTAGAVGDPETTTGPRVRESMTARTATTAMTRRAARILRLRL